VQSLHARTGAQRLGMAALHEQWQDTGFVPDVALRGGEVFELPGDSTLQVIHTPGHAGNHLCYRLMQQKMLFTGDHVMQGSTVVINPPDGDMSAYLRSLRELCELDLDWLAPGHGFLMAQPKRVIEQLIAHRHRREAKVLGALQADSQPVDVLLAQVYADVPPKLHAMARRSLLAHLLKLRDDTLAVDDGADGWRRSH
jgi:glyoxylase-like metal-dependent hydrolase (beta-lactamase superfamily II)